MLVAATRWTGTRDQVGRASGMGTLEAKSLDAVLLAIARAVGIDPDTYGRAIDDVRDW